MSFLSSLSVIFFFYFLSHQASLAWVGQSRFQEARFPSAFGQTERSERGTVGARRNLSLRFVVCSPTDSSLPHQNYCLIPSHNKMRRAQREPVNQNLKSLKIKTGSCKRYVFGAYSSTLSDKYPRRNVDYQV